MSNQNSFTECTFNIYHNISYSCQIIKILHKHNLYPTVYIGKNICSFSIQINDLNDHQYLVLNNICLESDVMDILYR